MQIGKVIRKYRKEKNMTQEEMACRLGVTAPAVNKWENGNSLPDIMLLAPIARLLDITLDTLLSFQGTLTEEEIDNVTREADLLLKKGSYADAFRWAKENIERYPNCKRLIWQLAVILDAQSMFQDVPEAKAYEQSILDWYEQVLNSEEEELRTGAADSLYAYYMRREQYEAAEKYLSYFSEQNPERKRKQAAIYSQTNRKEEAYKAYEELLFSGYQTLSIIFNSLFAMAMQEDNKEKAHRLAEKQRELARLFEMGKYYEASCGLELATAEKDGTAVLEIMQEMLESVGNITDFADAWLYEHMTFQKASPAAAEELKGKLMSCFRDEETFDFLKGDERWERLMEENGKSEKD